MTDTYTYTYSTFPIDERAAAAALGLDYAQVLKDREIAAEERAGVHGQERREVREAVDEVQRETQRQMLGLSAPK